MVCAELVILKSSHIRVGLTEHLELYSQVQRSGWFPSKQTRKGSDPRALVDRAAEGEERGSQHFFPVGRMLLTQDMQHGVKVAVSPLHGVGLGIVGWREGESNAGLLESLLHHLGSEVCGIVRVNLQGITKPRIKCLKSPQYLLAGGGAEGYGFKTLAEDVLQ